MPAARLDVTTPARTSGVGAHRAYPGSPEHDADLAASLPYGSSAAADQIFDASEFESIRETVDEHAVDIDALRAAGNDHATLIDDLVANGGGGGSSGPLFDAFFGNGAAAVLTITHSLGRTDYTVDIAEVTEDGDEPVEVRVRRKVNTVIVGPFASVPTTNQYRIMLE